MRFRQRVRTFHLKRVLRGQHHERRGQFTAFPGGGDGPFLHGFQKRRLGFGRGAVDFVGQQQLCEHRAGLETVIEAAAAGFNHLRARHVGGHQVGCELNATVLEAGGPREVLRQPGLA